MRSSTFAPCAEVELRQPRTDAELKTFAENSLGGDGPEHPLWDITVVRGREIAPG